MPDDFGGGLTWSIENNDMIELMELVIFGFLALWTLYVAVGAMRRVALDSGPPARDA